MKQPVQEQVGSLAVHMHPDLNEQDLEQVREMIMGLVEEANRRERERQMLVAVITWANAFTSFKRVRRNIGLPTKRTGWLTYGAILGALKASGKMLLATMLHEQFDPKAFISLEAFEACVNELAQDDKLLELGLYEADLSDVDAASRLTPRFSAAAAPHLQTP